jgi:hypothetical protein
MKKIIVLVSMLVIAAGCAAPPTNQPALDTNRNTNLAANTSSPALSEAEVTAKEKAIWEAIKQKDYTAFADMLSDDQIEVLSDGVHDKAGSVAGVKDFEPSEVNFSNWKYLPIDKDGVIIAYTVAMKGKFKGKDFPPETYRASSAWIRRNNKWLAVFHQECKVKKMEMPPPPPAPKDSPKPGASPAATPLTATTGADPIANEKLVWELFKSKNFDAFAALLAPDFLEVEPENYYDKAASVKALSTVDMSKTMSSDFKATKFGENTALVTYMLKDPGFAPKGEWHSTIWVNRGGKWMGLLHHGGTEFDAAAAAALAKPSASPATK